MLNRKGLVALTEYQQVRCSKIVQSGKLKSKIIRDIHSQI